MARSQQRPGTAPRTASGNGSKSSKQNHNAITRNDNTRNSGNNKTVAVKPASQGNGALSTIILAFVAYKTLLFCIALGTALTGPGGDYDTSTSLFFHRQLLEKDSGKLTGAGLLNSLVDGAKEVAQVVPLLARKLTRWDALYFVYAAREGFIYEQQWAFSGCLPLLTRSLRWLASIVGMTLLSDAAGFEAVLGVVIAHVSHLISTISLYYLTRHIYPTSPPLALTTALLHVISPASLFLSSPNAEAPFSALAFTALLVYAKAISNPPTSLLRQAGVLASGAVFGLATAFRSNGVLNGIFFLVELWKHLQDTYRRGPDRARLQSIIAAMFGGLCIFAGLVIPQFIAWKEYCGGSSSLRPWCTRLVPSIYTFVQEYYWIRNVGFLRYWTLPQLPLFLLAGPMLCILFVSGQSLLSDPGAALSRTPKATHTHKINPDLDMLVRTLAFAQLLLAILALTSYHVQIITRISSGYPAWYWWVTACLRQDKKQKLGQGIVVFMVMYAMIQGGLYASFLPPA